METKAQRKAARRAVSTLRKYIEHNWFIELVTIYGLNKARLMAEDAEKVNSFAPYKGYDKGSVVIWSETSYWADWAYTKHIN